VPRAVDLLVAGTPRSGTTLVQRLASELDGVRVPPETHFFSEFLPDLARRRRFPLAGDDLLAELRRYAARPYLDGVALDPEAVAAAVGGSAGDAVDLFCAVVEHLAGPGARVVGEKTPGHLAWWRPLAAALPGLKVVAVVRDPRGVVASFRHLGWGGDPLQNAARWDGDAAAALAARDRMGAARCLLLRYEDVVADPGAARDAIAGLLGRPATGDGPAGDLFPAWEAWKERAGAEVDRSRATAWRDELDAGVATAVAAVCRRRMAALGYEAPSAGAAAARLARLGPTAQARRLARRARNARTRATVARLSRTWQPR
jgi:Sulfotransferase family